MLHVCPAWSGDALLGWEYSVWGDAHLEAVSKGYLESEGVQRGVRFLGSQRVGTHLKAEQGVQRGFGILGFLGLATHLEGEVFVEQEPPPRACYGGVVHVREKRHHRVGSGRRARRRGARALNRVAGE
eukprot:1186411-Prorocentrum_minimum.AAC.2